MPTKRQGCMEPGSKLSWVSRASSSPNKIRSFAQGISMGQAHASASLNWPERSPCLLPSAAGLRQSPRSVQLLFAASGRKKLANSGEEGGWVRWFGNEIGAAGLNAGVFGHLAGHTRQDQDRH